MSTRLAAVLDDTRKRSRARDTSDWGEKERILIEACHPKQRDFVLDPAARVVALTGRGCGKTTADRARLMRRMMRTPKAKCLFVAATRDQAIELMWSPLKDLIEKLGIEASFNETALRCVFRRNGAQLRLVGADDKRQIEKYRGQPHHEVIIDEAASFPAQLLEHLIFRIIAPRLGDYNGVLVLNGTPGHHLSGPFYDATRPGSEVSRPWADRDKPEFLDWQRWSFHSWSLQDGAPYVPALRRLWDEALVEKERNGWSDSNPVWLREYLGFWAADDTETVFRYRPHLDDGTEWNQWSPEIDRRTGIAILPPGEWRYVYALDLGHSDPTALVIWAWCPGERVLRHVYNFERRGMYAKTIAELLIGPELNTDHPGGLFGATGWPDAIVADTAGLGDALLDELSHVYGIKVEPAVKRDKFDNIELFNGELVDGRIKVLKGSSLETQLQQLQWAVDEFGRLKEHKGQANHSTDAAIYGRTAAMHRFKDDEPPAPRPAWERLAESEDFNSVGGEYSGFLDDGNYDSDLFG